MDSHMSAHDLAFVILAAGKGTRLKSNLAKVLHRAGGRPLVEHVVRACKAIRGAEITVVVGHQAEDVRAAVESLGANTVLQDPQRGTGHAVQIAKKAIRKRAKYAVVLPGDAPLIRPETLKALVDKHLYGKAAATILSAQLEDPTGYGRVIRRQDGRVAAIIEDRALAEGEREINEVNSSIYCFTLEKLWPCLHKLKPENVHKELYLTDAIAMLDAQGDTVLAEIASNAQEILGCNTRAEIAEVDRIFRARKRAELMDAGVSIRLPETVLIDAEVEVGADTIIEPNVQLLGKTRIGAGCTIRAGSIIADSVLEENVVVKPYCMIFSSWLGEGVHVGPFAHIREGAEIRRDARVGNFVEVKNSVLESGVKSMHLTYLGDAKIGAGTNVGAGTITCNYDGVKKNRTNIGKRVFVGSNTALVAPVKIGDGAYIAAGSTITDDIPKDSLGIARGEQVNKKGWAKAKRAESSKIMKAKTKMRRR